MYTIYIKQRTIRIIPLGGNLESSQDSDRKKVVWTLGNNFQVPDLVQKIREMVYLETISDHPEIIEIYHNHPKTVMKEIKQNLKYIKAAGGLVRNEKKEYLFIFRLGVWDLPKGKLEAGEDIVTCAKREVEEECGVSIALVKRELPSTYHIYVMNDQLIMKRTYWFLMKAKEGEVLVPQTEEGITEVSWVNRDDFGKIRENTYPSVLEVMKSIPE